MTDSADLLAAAEDAVDTARQLVLQRTLGQVRAKDDRDFVSDLDVAVERTVRTLLRSRTPDVGFLGEEEGWSDLSIGSRYWVLDPIDGTTNLLKSIPLCAISIALIEGDRATVGVVDAPFLATRYTAIKGHGAYSAGQRLGVNTTERIEDAVVAFGDYAVGHGAETKNRLRFAVAEQLAVTVQRVRMFGSAALDLAWVAEGKLDASVILSNNPWDTAAGALLAREAGARVVDATGHDHTVRSAATIAAPEPLLERLVGLVKRAETVQRPAV